MWGGEAHPTGIPLKNNYFLRRPKGIWEKEVTDSEEEEEEKKEEKKREEKAYASGVSVVIEGL